MNFSFFNMLAALFGLAFSIASSAATISTVQLAPFSAEYVLSKDGKAIGESVFTLKAAGDGVWRYTSVTHGTAGLAKLLDAEVEETSVFRVRNGHLELLSNEYRLNALLHSQTRQTQVDWAARTVSVTDSRKGANSYQAPPGLLDRHLLSLALARHLQQDSRFGLPVTTQDHAEAQHYEVTGSEQVKVPAGTFAALHVRRSDPGKHLSAWYVPSRFPIPVKLVQDGDEHLTLELKSFSG